MNSNNSNTALLVMDMQTSLLKRLPDADAFTDNVAKAISHARKLNMPVLYVVVGFRPGMPEISSNNKGFSASKEQLANVSMEQWKRIDTAVLPLEHEIVITKRRISAFTGSDLEVVLRGLGIEHLILTGISTSGVVLSTVREAADKDYRLTVLSNGCADVDPEVHRVLTTKIFPRQAEVMTIEEWIRL